MLNLKFFHPLLASIALIGCAQSDWRGAPAPPPELEGLRRPELVAFTPEDDLTATPSPDGRYLVFASEQNGNLDVWVRDFGTNSIYPLTIASPTDDFDPEISPDGKKLAFVSRRDDAKGDLFVADGFEQEDEPERLTDEKTSDRQPVFAPDGKKLYFTSASGVGFEYISELDLDTRERKRISPTPGFDPEVSIDGRWLIYTAPAGEGGRPAPHVVAMRLSDSATRALTRSDSPEGFARFVPGARHAIVYVRFPDDDDGDGNIDAHDAASLWRLDVDLEARFDRNAPPAASFPLTDGSDNELFPRIANGALYFTQGTLQQDVLRLPASGMFPRYPEPSRYFELAQTLDEPRKRWFAYRCALALTEPHSLLHAQALLKIGNLQLEQARNDLARAAFAELLAATEGAESGSPRAELRGIAEAELVSLDRIAELARASNPFSREAALVGVWGRLEDLRDDYAGVDRVMARIDLEMAEVLIDRGERTRAIEALDRLIVERAEQTFSAARAMLRRTELLGVAHDPDAIGEAYAQVLERYPEQREVVREASRRIVEVHVSGHGRSVRERVDELRRLIPRYGESPVRLEARVRVSDLLLGIRAYDDAALELARLADEAKALEDRLASARALERLAQVEEKRGRLDAAAEAWARLRQEFGELPGVTSNARDAITRVNLERADREERKGDAQAARAAYRNVIDNDPSQVEAHRRYLALSDQVGELSAALDQARARVEESPNTPVARYAYGLALTYDQDLSGALEEIERAIELNPQFVQAYITHGWIKEMQQLLEPTFLDDVANFGARLVNFALGELLEISIGTTGLLEDAIEDYKTALRLNQESARPDLEAEILINLGNGHYRLGETTKDTSNFRLAFERYLDASRFDYRFKSPATEMIYWERFGRAASWSEEWGLSAMATRRAIRLAEGGSDRRRLAQLYGNLALAYQQAGEEAYARDALERFGSELEQKKLIARSVIAKRERARAQLGSLEDRSGHTLNKVLHELATARRDLEEAGTVERDIPDVWVSVTADASSALYGFDSLSELDLNLALAEEAHRGLGDSTRADALGAARLSITRRALDEVPSAVLGLGRRWPLALLSLRERMGLFAHRARQSFASGDRNGGTALVEQALAELDDAISSDDTEKDRHFLWLDRGRMIAFGIEQSIAAGGAIADEASIDAALGKTATVAVFGAERAPASLTTTAAIALTASIAQQHPAYSGWPREHAAVKARLEHARGLVRLAKARSAIGGEDLKSLFASLDGAQVELTRAREAFVAAARYGATAGHGLGARTLALSLFALFEIDRTRGVPKERTDPLMEAASAVARFDGDLDLVAAFAVARALYDDDALEAAEKRLAVTPPGLMRGHEKSIELMFARTASLALAKGETEKAIAALDRSLAYRRAIGPLHLDALAKARRELAWSEPSQWAAAIKRLEAEVARIESGAESYLAGGDVASAAYELAEEEAILFPVAIDGRVHLFLVETSSAGDPSYIHRATRASAESLRADLISARKELGENRPLSDALKRRIDSVLFEPVRKDLAEDSTIFVASGDMGGPVPRLSLEGPAFANLSVPSALEKVRSAQLVGVAGKLALAGALDPPLAEVERRLTGPELMGFREGPPKIDLVPGKLRRLDDRTPVEELAARAQETVLIEAEVRLEPGALERSVIVANPQLEDADAFTGELPLGSLDVPAKILILASTSDLPPGEGAAPNPADTVLGLDLALVGRGVATTVAIPKSIPVEVRKSLVARFLEIGKDRSAAVALLEAQRELAPASPSVLLAQVIGSPGLDSAATKAFALKRLKSASASAGRAFKNRQYRQAVDAIERWIRLQLASGKEDQIVFAYNALIGILSEHLDPPELPRAADRQQDLVSYLREKTKPGEELLSARLTLGLLYSKAQDFDRAKQTFTELIDELTKAGDLMGLGHAYHDFALHKRDMLEDAAAVELLERSIAVYEKAGAYLRKKRPREADSAVLRVAEIQLNRLSDPVRAQAAFVRALGLAQTDESRLDIELGLARAARRRGDFERAEQSAEKARAEAAAKNLPELEVSALIEAANVSWYRGDYQRSAELCDTSLSRVGELLERIRKTGSLVPVDPKEKKPKDQQSLASLRKRVRRLEIYTLSVCGVTAMSQRDFQAAKKHLERARRIAEAIKDEREVATQYNNLGRAHLEFGHLNEAIEVFRAAEAIDRRLKDQYALAYDLRNLGRALALKGEVEKAKQALTTALMISREVKDQNNELRARFALGELYREKGEVARAFEEYTRALPIADRFQVKDLKWSIHRGLGLMHRTQGDLKLAEVELRKAIATARTITGRVAASDFGPDRWAAFDDLIALLLDQTRSEEAFAIAEQTRSLELSELAEDPRLNVGGAEVAELWRMAKGAETATGAASALEALEKKNKKLARLLRADRLEDVRARLPEDAGILMYRVTEEGVVIFAIDRDRISAKRSSIPRAELRELVGRYTREMAARADVTESNAKLAEVLLAPVAKELEGKQRVAIVAHGPLRYVAFAALPFEKETFLDRFVLSHALGPESAADALATPLPAIAKKPIIALGAPLQSLGTADAPLRFADKELELIREEYPNAEVFKGSSVTRDVFLSSLARAGGVLHFAGHSYLAGDGPRSSDPLGGVLRTSDAGVSMLDVLNAKTSANLVVLSACHTLISPDRASSGSGDELRSLAQAFRYAGAGWVLATSMHVDDLTSSLVMKRFYRAARNEDVPHALRRAQLDVKKLHPHPAWWATFSLLL
jgi:CHAT domain-containing protein